MQTLLRFKTSPVVEDERPNPRLCVTPGCRHRVSESWEESGRLCPDCAIEGELYDREGRWDHVSQIPGTHLLPF
jgi:hypothetical protein